MDCHAGSEGPEHASKSQEVCVCFFLFEKMKSTGVQWVGKAQTSLLRNVFNESKEGILEVV